MKKAGCLRRILGWLKWIGIAIAALLLVAALVTYVAMRSSLPRAEGMVTLKGLSAPVEIARDALGVPSIRGQSLLDLFRAQGFLHGQERFFQMDFTRRFAAGEFAELLGLALPADRQIRVHRYRRLAGQALAALPARHREMLQAYSDGVNAGLADLGARPPEYLILQVTPKPWTSEDSILVLFFFFMGLSVNHEMEEKLGVMDAILPAALFEFLTPSRSRFDAPLMGVGEGMSAYQPQPVPGPEAVDLRRSPPPEPKHDVIRPFGLVAGSNAWAVAGSKTEDGRAMLANDPHLSLLLPNAWYRAELFWEGRQARGVSLPGMPGITIGATLDLAWGITNSFADQTDWVVIETDPDDPSRYRTPEGLEPFRLVSEDIRVRGQDEPEKLEIRLTRWGPVVSEDWKGRPLALRSTVQLPGGVNADFLDLILASTVEESLDILKGWNGPALGWMLADSAGRIGWIVNGYLPRRKGFSGKVPRSRVQAQLGWDGPLPEALRPLLANPPDGILFSANNRPGSRSGEAEVSQAWLSPVRAHRIAERLKAQQKFSEEDFLAIQLDTRSPLHDQARDLVLDLLQEEESDPLLARVRRHVQAWNGHADRDQVGFRILEAYYDELMDRVLTPLLAPVLEAEERFVYNWPLATEPLHRILETRPPHLLPAGQQDWPAFLRQILLDTVQAIQANEDSPGVDEPWGAVNRSGIQHPLGLVPGLGWLFSMPDDPLPGWMGTVRAAAPGYGASLRLVVSPVDPSSGIFHMPGGQSGHFLSSHFGDGHAAWVEGLPAPLQAGRAQSSFTLQPPE